MADRGFVVGVSGVPDAGKTTLMRLLLRDCRRASAVSYDRYRTFTRMTTAQAREWFARGADPNDFDLSELVGELTRRTQVQPGEPVRPLVLFETPFARLHRASGAFIDFLIWVDTPLDIALSRAILAFIEQALQNSAPNAAADFVKWQRRYLINYQNLHTMYATQRETILPTADLVVDGGQPAAQSAALVRQALAARGVIEP
jgi:uridine kinase